MGNDVFIVGVGIQLLTSILEEHDLNTFRKIRTDWFRDENERRTYDFIKDHIQHYKQLPTTTTMVEEGFTLSDEELDSPAYYLSKTSDRESRLLASEYQELLGQAMASNDMRGFNELLVEAKKAMNSASSSPETLTIQQSSRTYMEGVKESMFSSGLRGVTFGYDVLDEATGGQMRGDLSLIVGRPKQGKTQIALKSIISAWFAGHSGLVVSMEMSPSELAGRMLSQIAQIDSSLLRQGKICSFQYDDVQDVIRGFDNMPPLHFVAGNFRKSTADIARYVAELNPRFILADGAYLLQSCDRTTRTAKHEIIANVASEMKADAEDSQTSYLATVQFNRAASVLENNTSRRTKVFDLAHIGGSDALGQTATNIMGIVSPEGVGDKRRIKLMGTRDGNSNPDFEINFLFNPPNFEYIRDYEEGAEEVEVPANDATTMAMASMAR